MMDFFKENWGTVLIGAAVAAAAAGIIAGLIKDGKKGKRSCGCGCGNCPSAGICHNKK